MLEGIAARQIDLCTTIGAKDNTTQDYGDHKIWISKDIGKSLVAQGKKIENDPTTKTGDRKIE